MKTRPILFSGPMVRAILEGRKSQTRRVMKPQPVLNNGFYEWAGAGWDDRITRVTPMLGHSLSVRCPYGIPGDHLWVRETFAVDYEHGEDTRGAIPPMVYYRADDAATPWPRPQWKPSIFMPRALSRITLEITDVRVERVQSIRDEDFVPEGFPYSPDRYEDGFAHYWEKLNAKRGYGWSTNPWVWVLVFRRVTP